LHGSGTCKNACIIVEIASVGGISGDVANSLRSVSPRRAPFFQPAVETYGANREAGAHVDKGSPDHVQ
jgi:hypothetical protein